MTQPTTSRGWPVPLCLALVLGGLVLPALPVGAATLHVTNCTDSGVSGDGSLRGEIAAAGAGDTILFDQNCIITLIKSSGTLTLATNMTIDGTGHTVIVDGGCSFSDGQCQSGGVRVFAVNSGVTASLSNLTIRHGLGVQNGGGIRNSGTLTVTNCTLTENENYQDGGGINNGGTLTVTNSTISANLSFLSAGGISNGGTATITNSTISGNFSYNAVGGIANGGTLTLTNTIVAGNGGINNDITGTVTSGGHNLIGDTTGSSGITNGMNGDIVNPTPQLGTLGNYGGLTQTIPLLAGSPAIDTGDTAACASTTTPAAAPVGGKDQRGRLRRTDRCSIGAFEADPAIPNAVPGAKPPGGTGGSPGPLPASRPTGTTGGPAPNPLPAPRP